MRKPVVILGGGIAGCSAALAARLSGSPVTIVEKSAFPRHKVCGEFLSPEVLPLLADLGLDDAFLALNPAPIRRVVLNFFGREKRFPLPHAAFGLSRYEFDRLLFNHALAKGAAAVPSAPEPPAIVAAGRGALASSGGLKGTRIFGFKAHFTGPVNDAVELYFFNGGYIGVNPVENGTTNVCGLCSESTLAALHFRIDRLVDQVQPLAGRLRHQQKLWNWLHVGPLVFTHRLNERSDAYLAGDALAFVDPFTGSGMLAALMSGTLAGRMAASGTPATAYALEMKRNLTRSSSVSAMLRWAVWNSKLLRFAPLVPGTALFHLTRPRKPAKVSHK